MFNALKASHEKQDLVFNLEFSLLPDLLNHLSVKKQVKLTFILFYQLLTTTVVVLDGWTCPL